MKRVNYDIERTAERKEDKGQHYSPLIPKKEVAVFIRLMTKIVDWKGGSEKARIYCGVSTTPWATLRKRGILNKLNAKRILTKYNEMAGRQKPNKE